MEKLAKATLAVVLSILLHHTACAAPFSELISFGDSLTDVGNVAGVTTPGYAPVIDGYYEETHFSDNILWNEVLADYWDLPARTPGRTAISTLPAETTGNTWAWGGSAAGTGYVQPTGVTTPIPDLLTEVSDYLSTNTASHTALYSIWSGADNLLVEGHFGPEAAAAAVASVKTAIQNLEAAGARNFLLLNMPKLGSTPYAISGGPVSIAAAELYAISYNVAMDAALVELRADPEFRGTIYFVNTYTLLEDIVDSVEETGTYTPSFFVPGDPVLINNVTAMGITYFNTTGGQFPPNYLFWDDVHPTTQGHQLVAGLALASIVPEPPSHTLFIVALSILGILAAARIARRNKKRPAASHN